MSKIEIPEEVLKQFNDEFDLFANTKEAREFCFGNYNNATRDEQVGRYCYVNAKSSSYQREQALIAEVDKLKRAVKFENELFNDQRDMNDQFIEYEKEYVDKIQKLQEKIEQFKSFPYVKANAIMSYKQEESTEENKKLQERILELEKFIESEVGEPYENLVTKKDHHKFIADFEKTLREVYDKQLAKRDALIDVADSILSAFDEYRDATDRKETSKSSTKWHTFERILYDRIKIEWLKQVKLLRGEKL